MLTDFFGGVSEVELVEDEGAAVVQEAEEVEVEVVKRSTERRKRRREGIAEFRAGEKEKKGKRVNAAAVAGGVVALHLGVLYVASVRRSGAQ